jgi:hypothetical protein
VDARLRKTAVASTFGMRAFKMLERKVSVARHPRNKRNFA